MVVSKQRKQLNVLLSTIIEGSCSYKDNDYSNNNNNSDNDKDNISDNDSNSNVNVT